MSNPAKFNPTPAQPFDFVKRLQTAQDRVRNSVLYKRFIDGTPLENDIAIWMTEFAAESVREALRADVPPPQPISEAEKAYMEPVERVVHETVEKLTPWTLEQRIAQWREQAQALTPTPAASDFQRGYAEGRQFAFDRCADEAELVASAVRPPETR